jgi:beta-glucosidase
VPLKAGETRRVSFEVPPRLMSRIDEEGRRVLEPGRLRICVGGRQPDRRSEDLAGTAVLNAEVEVVGERRVLPY